MLEKARTRMCDDGIAADDRYTVQQDRTSLLMLTTIAARAARCCCAAMQQLAIAALIYLAEAKVNACRQKSGYA